MRSRSVPYLVWAALLALVAAALLAARCGVA